jgi:predicted amidohydrolase
VKIACAQISPLRAELDSNLKTIESLLASTEADLVVFPELSTSGYFFTSADEISKYALNSSSERFDEIKEICKTLKRNCVLGFAEKDNGALYNSAMLITSDGETSGLYRKVHLFYYEKVVFSPGNLSFPVFDIPVADGKSIKLGIEICYDWRFPEATRSLALLGAQVIVMPSNIVATTGMLLETLRVRAFENKVILAFCDRVGMESETIGGEKEVLLFRGESAIINYNGDIIELGSTDKIEVITSEVLPEKTISKEINKYNNITTDRQSNMYNL